MLTSTRRTLLGAGASVGAPPSLATSTVSASASTLAADGASTSTITVQLKDVAGNNTVSSSAVIALSATHGTLGSVTTSDHSAFTATYTAPASLDTSATVSGTLNGQALTNTAALTLTAGDSGYLAAQVTGGVASLPAFYTGLAAVSVTSSGGVASAWADARGAGHAPNLTSAGSKQPGWDGRYLTFDGSDDLMTTALDALFAINGAYTLWVIAQIRQTSASAYDALIAESASEARGLGLINSTGAGGTIGGEVESGVAFVDKFSTVVVGTNLRLSIVTKDATTGIGIEVPATARVSGTNSASVGAGTCALTLGGFFGGGTQGKPIFSAVGTLNRLATAGDITALKAMAATYHSYVPA